MRLVEIAKEPVVVQLANGREFKIPPANLNTLSLLSKRIEEKGKSSNELKFENIDDIIYFLYLLLSQDNKDITEDEVKKIINVNNMQLFQQAINESFKQALPQPTDNSQSEKKN